MKKRYFKAFLEYKKTGENKYIAINKNDNTTHTVSLLEAKFLNSISGCKTIEEHLESIIEHDEFEMPRSVFFQQADNWIRKGFLRKAELLFRNSLFLTGEKATKDNLVSGCLTNNRTDMLDNWLRTRITSEDYRSSKINIIISDDSIDKETLINNRNAVRKYKKKHTGKISLIDKNTRILFSKTYKSFTGRTYETALLDFALGLTKPLGKCISIGSNQNTLLLGSAGQYLYSSDDDIEYRFYKTPDTSTDISFLDNYIYQSNFFPDMNNLSFDAEEVNNYSLIKIFNEFSGVNRKESFDFKNYYNSSKNCFEKISAKTAFFLEKNTVKLKCISAGYYGARWYKNPYLPLFHQGTERDIIFQNFRDYAKIKNNGLNYSAADHYVFNNGDFLMGATYFLDNIEISPPEFPFGRRNDTIFGLLLNRCLGPVFTLHLPIALFHNPKQKKPFTVSSFKNVAVDTGIYLTNILQNLTMSFTNSCAEDKLAITGTRLEETGKLSINDFKEYLKLNQIEYITTIMAHIDSLAEYYDNEPPWWAEDMDQYYNLLKKEVAGKDTEIPEELRHIMDKKEALKLFQSNILRYGELLQLWPEIWETSRKLNQEGNGLVNQ